MVNVSVIIPVYNVERYLPECLESIFAQEFESMEILCVEDCSEDGSLEILEKYVQKDHRVRIIRHNQNRGLSAARNTGLDNATGKYVLFVDSDDFLEKNAIQLLYHEAEKKETDIVYFDYIRFCDESPADIVAPKTVRHSYDGGYTGREFFCATMQNNEFEVMAWRQFFRRDFLEQNHIRFLEGIYHEDNLFSFYAAMEAQRVCNLSDVLYHYRQRENSIMQTKNEKRAQSMFVILTNLFFYWKNHEFSEEQSFCIGMYWENLYKVFLFYKSYGDSAKALPFGDAADKEVYRILQSSGDRKWLDVDKLPLDKVRAYTKIIVYGAGKAARQVVSYLGQNDINVSAIMVRNKNVNADVFCGIQVYEVEEGIDLTDDCVVIIGVTSKYSSGIEELLKDTGFKHIIKLPDGEGKRGDYGFV